MLRRITIRFLGPLGTPLASGTLFGHLCWAYLDSHGEDALAAWLADMESRRRPPFLISDGMPSGFLPRPLTRPELPKHDLGLDEAAEQKRKRKAALVPREAFLNLRAGATEDAWGEAALEASPPSSELVRHAHNRIDRIRNTTPERAGIWFIDDEWFPTDGGRFDIYVESDLDEVVLRDLFARVGENGFGRDSTYGRGFFVVEEVAEDAELEAFAGNRLVSLSRGSLTANMQDPRYRRTTHFGKLGSRMNARTGRPWKKPVLLMLPGATFAPADRGPFGELLSKVHIDLPETVRFNAWHLAIPYREVEA